MKYFNLKIEATNPTTKIWIGDDEDNFVQMEKGVLKTSLLSGRYSVQFELGTKKYQFDLQEDLVILESEIC